MATRNQENVQGPDNRSGFSGSQTAGGTGGRDVATGHQGTTIPEIGDDRYIERGRGYYRAALDRQGSGVRSYGYGGYDRDLGGMQSYPSDDSRRWGGMNRGQTASDYHLGVGRTEDYDRNERYSTDRSRGVVTGQYNRDFARGDYPRGEAGRGGDGGRFEPRGDERYEGWRADQGQGRTGGYGQGLGYESQPATQGGQQQQQRRGRWEREPLTAREVMTTNIKTVRRDSTLREVAIIMRDESCGIVPVVDQGSRLVGVVTDRDMVMRSVDEDRAWTQIKVESVMSDDVEAVTPDESVHDIIHLMGKKQIRRVPVVDRNDRLLGMISLGDLATRADLDEELQGAFERISSRRSFWSRLFS